MQKSFWVYILTNQPFGTLYIGVTSDLPRRCYEHREGICDGFTKKYSLKRLVYCEEYSTAYEAITREKELKKWRRDWKMQLIEKLNPTWQDLYENIN